MSNSPRIQRTARRLQASAQLEDARFFEAHPMRRAYTRPATPAELRETGYPPGTRVYVARLGPTVRARAFLLPNIRQN